jgi:2-dehydropantoate 2-reductase
MRICIYGAGAVGGNLAARLALAGNDVSVVARGAQLAAIRERGITIHAGDAKLHTNVRASDKPADLGMQDVVFSTLKANSLASLASGIAPLKDRHTLVVFAQNGIPWWYTLGLAHAPAPLPDLSALDPEGALHAAMPRRAIVAGVLYSANTVLSPGVIDNSSWSNNRILVARIDDTVDEPLRALRAALEAAGIASGEVADVRREIWQKLVSNLVTGMTVLVGEATSKMMEDPHMRRVAEAVVSEAVAVARAHGVAIEARMPSVPTGKKSSILQDWEQRRTMEVESQFLAPLAFARSARVTAPTLDAVASTIAHLAAAKGLYAPA